MSETLDKREQAADRIRDELALTLRELDRRRHAATDLRYQVQSHRELVAMAGGGMVALVLLAVSLRALRRRRARRPEVLLRRRAEALRRVWEHPEQVAGGPVQRPLLEELPRTVLSAFVGALASRAARQAARRMLPGKHAPGAGVAVAR